MFAVLIPAALMPLILTLFWGERQAKKLGLVHVPHPSQDLVSPVKERYLQRAWLFAEQLDLIGLILLAAAVALILLPMTLAQREGNSWSSRTPLHNIPNRLHALTRPCIASMIVMVVLGWTLLPVFAIWDVKFAKRPVIARRFLSNRTVLCAAWIGFFDFVRVPVDLLLPRRLARLLDD